VAPAITIMPGQVLPATRNNHTTTLLPNGKLLVAGGSSDGTASGAARNAYLYDPATGAWAETGNLNTARFGHFAVLLRSGKVLVAGGTGLSGVLRSAELYDPVTGSWETTGSLITARVGATGSLISFASNAQGTTSGFALAVGGNSGSGALKSAELYNPTTGAWR